VIVTFIFYISLRTLFLSSVLSFLFNVQLNLSNLVINDDIGCTLCTVHSDIAIFLHLQRVIYLMPCQCLAVNAKAINNVS